MIALKSEIKIDSTVGQTFFTTKMLSASCPPDVVFLILAMAIAHSHDRTGGKVADVVAAAGVVAGKLDEPLKNLSLMISKFSIQFSAGVPCTV